MIRFMFLLILFAFLIGCAPERGTIGQLRQVEIAIEQEINTGGVDKAIASYEQFLEKTKKTPMTAEAIRRLADLKVEKEYGLISETSKPDIREAKHKPSEKKKLTKQEVESTSSKKVKVKDHLEKSTTASKAQKNNSGNGVLASAGDLERAGAKEAIILYQKLLDEFPEYEQNDQTLYQLSRAYEEQGQLKEAMLIMNRLVADFPDSRHMDEVQFRRGENFFVRRKYNDAQKAYGSVVSIGEKSDFYVRALYKHGWSFYKQELYVEALHQYIALLDYKAANNFNFENITDKNEGKRVKDTLRIISQSFSSLGGVNAVIGYFSKYGNRAFEDVIYANLAEYYFSKQRYNDAVTTYTTFAERNPSHRQAPLFTLRVIDINKSSGFASLVIEAKKAYANNYVYGADYWKYFNPDNRPKVIVGLKENLIDLANHYHALYQNKRLTKEKPANLKEALRWYREYLSSFPRVAEAPNINYQLAELLLENGLFAEAAQEYEKTAYVYSVFDKGDKAGYAAVYAYRQHLKQVADKDKEQVRRDAIRVSLKFAKFYPKHKKATAVLANAVDELYDLKDYKLALIAARDLIKRFPGAAEGIRRSSWLVAAHSAYELEDYSEAEKAYTEVLKLIPAGDTSRKALTDNLVASIYKQGEAANRVQNYKRAADHFLRITTVAPTSSLRPTAEYDGAVALIKIEEWQGAATVLTGFRKSFPKHELQREVTKKLAYIYREDGKFALAAVEFERIESESTDSALRQEVLLSAAELYEKVKDLDRAVNVYRRYVGNFPEPIEVNIETRDKLASILKLQDKRNQYHEELRQIVSQEAKAGAGQTVRTRQIASVAALVLAKLNYDECISVRLVKPFKKNLQRKQESMKKATEFYSRLFDYEIGDVTAEATFYLAEIYADFSKALLESERPEELSALELEQYELAIEDQAYPFEEKAIEMHQSNLELISRDVYNAWIDKSLEKLAVFMPARYDKQEVKNNKIAFLTEFRFENIALRPLPRVNAEPASEVKVNKVQTVNQ